MVSLYVIATLACVAFINLFLYCYPLFRGISYLMPVGRPPLRVLILTDLHLEGDSKVARMGWRGAVDIWGNDHYLGHIHRVAAFFVRPTQTVVLGDHMSSQWIDDVEFRARAKRMEERVLRFRPGDVVFNISGNHDIGYAGEMTSHRLNRWHDRFGPSNFIHRLDASELPAGAYPLRFVAINNLQLDGPADDEIHRGMTHTFLQTLPDDGATTILLAHVPMHKEVNVCTDPPYMHYYDFPRVLLRAQNHLSPESTKALLDAVFTEHGGIILTGHDHQGCHTYHSKSRDGSEKWTAGRWSREAVNVAGASSARIVEEVTVRSMMGQYQGNVGVLTADWNAASKRWEFKYKALPFMHNTLWWICKGITVVGLLLPTGSWLIKRTVAGRQAEQGLRRWVSVRSRRRKTRDY